MSIESLPLIVLLLLPGFLSWFIFCWGTVSHKISQLQYLFACLILSVLVFSIAYPLTSLFMPLPGYMRILSNPTVLPLELGIAIYLTAIGFGFLMIGIYKNKNTKGLFNRVGLDLYGHEHTWHRLFHESDYVTVYLKDGTIVAGWPTHFSQSGDKETAELYLTKIHYYQKECWIKPDQSVEGLLINTALISRIEFRNPTTGNREDISPVEGNSLSKILSRTDFSRMGMLLFSFGLILFRIQDWGSGSVNSGFSFVILSLVIFMPATISSKTGARINRFIGRMKNTRVRNLPVLVEWYLVVGIFAVAFTDGLISLIKLKQASVYLYTVYGIGILWFVAILIELYSRFHPKQSV